MNESQKEEVMIPLEAVESMIGRVMDAQSKMQAPFFAELTRQLSSMDQRIALLGNSMTQLQRDVDRLSVSEVKQDLLKLEDKVSVLVAESNQRAGATKLASLVPVWFSTVILLVGMAVTWVISKGKFTP